MIFLSTNDFFVKAGLYPNYLTKNLVQPVPWKTRNAELRCGWVFLERTQILSGIQFTTHFIEIFVVQTNRFVGSSLKMCS